MYAHNHVYILFLSKLLARANVFIIAYETTVVRNKLVPQLGCSRGLGVGKTQPFCLCLRLNYLNFK